MRTFRSLVSVIAALAIILSLSFSANAQEYKKVTRLGTSQAVCSGGVDNLAELQEFFAANPDAVRTIVADAGWIGNPEVILAAVANGDVIETAYPVGTRMAWMGAKDNGVYNAKRYREWAGNQSFEAFTVNIVDGCDVHEIAIPKACCNVALLGVSASTAEECTAAPVAAAPAAPEATVVEEKKLGWVPFFGAFAGTETRPRFETAWEMYKRDSSGIVGLRAGALKSISDKTNVFGQVSYYDRQGINGGNVYPEDNLALDIGVERRLSDKAFIGGGIGVWNIDDSDFRDASLFGLVGGDIGKSNFQWFLEGRVFDSDVEELDSFSSNRMFSAGLRYLVK